MLNVFFFFSEIQLLYLEFVGYDASHSNYTPKIYVLGKFIAKPAFFCLKKSGTRLLPVLLQLQVMTWYIIETHWIMSKNEKKNQHSTF